ncbi:vWA domain-containing protein [Hoeflea sp.]
MQKKLSANILAASLWAASCVAVQAGSANHVMFILDASNSMWGRIDGKPKMEIAKDVLSAQLGSLSANTRAGLIVYGHRFDRDLNDCSDMELVGGYGRYTPSDVRQMLEQISPKGQTPIAAALEQSTHWATMDGSQTVDNASIVLITDGVESCDGDPCAAAAELAAVGIGTRVHVVGFNLEEEDRAKLACIAEMGRGKYFDAANADALGSALKQVGFEVAQTDVPPDSPQPDVPVTTSIFVDDFDGTELQPHWSVQNSDTDAYIVENGELLTISGQVGGFNSAETANIFVLNEALPDGDWDAKLTFSAELKTGRDGFQFGLFKDHDNGLYATLWTKKAGNPACSNIGLTASKWANGEETLFEIPLMGRLGCFVEGKKDIFAFYDSLAETPSTITMHKRGRSYFFTGDFGRRNEDGEPIIFETEPLTSLRTPGNLAITLGKRAKAKGEIAAMIDKVEIFSVSQ